MYNKILFGQVSFNIWFVIHMYIILKLNDQTLKLFTLAPPKVDDSLRDGCLKPCPGDIDRAIPVATKIKMFYINFVSSNFIAYSNYWDQKLEH